MDVPDPQPDIDDGVPGLDRYAEVIEQELIPRLLHATRAGPLSPSAVQRARDALEAAQVTEFVARVRGADEGASDRFVEELLDDGSTAEAIYLDLLAPAARHLGRLWEEDSCDFVEVTLALGRLQRTLRNLSHLFLAHTPASPPVGQVLLSCAPGEQHTLGVIMVAEFFVRDGWEVQLASPREPAELCAAVAGAWYHVVGISVACDGSMPHLRRNVGALRRASCNPAVRVMVGGRVFDGRPELVRRVGADATAPDARAAPTVAAGLLATA